MICILMQEELALKVVIIGGVAAGMSAASKIKRTDPSCQVIVYERGGYLSYGACGLPYYIGGFNNDHTKMIARTQEQFQAVGINTNLFHEVLKVSPETKHLLVKNLKTGEVFADDYDKLLIASGCSPVIPPIKGIDAKGIYFVKTLEDGLVLREMVSRPEVKQVVIVGGGYIGVEMVDAFLHLDKQVTLIENKNRILDSFEPEFSQLAEQELISKGVRLCTGETVLAFDGNPVTQVTTDKGSYPCDLVICAVGVIPSTGFMKGTGLQMARNGAIIVDRELRTSLPDIYAAGDCAVAYHRVLEDNVFLPLGTIANKCGRLAGGNMLGQHQKFIGTLGSNAIKVCDLEMARTGISSRDARQLKLDIDTVMVTANDHPAYYPNPTPITIKLLYDKRSKRLLGAQTAGQKGAVLRLDVLAVAIQAGMTTDELGMTDLVYAPPFAGVWDAIHIACNAAK